MIQIIPIQIQKETSADKEAYLKDRGSKYEKVIKASAPDRNTSQDDSNKQAYLQHLLLLCDGKMADLSLTPLKDPAALASAQAFKEKVAAIFPLIEGETLVEEHIGLVINQIYVKQVTNLSTLCFTDPSMIIAPAIEETAISPTSSVAATDNPQEEAEALQKAVATAVEIGQGLVKIVPAPYGTVLSGAFDALSAYLKMTSKPEAEKDTEKMINQIGELVGKIVWKANVQTEIKRQEGIINSVITDLTETYGPLKKESKADYTHKEIVENYLNKFRSKLIDAISTLSLSDYDVASLPKFCLAADAYFCVLQELAVLDPDHQDDPFKSTHCNEIKNIKAPKFIKYVNDTYDKIIKMTRESVISTTEYKYRWISFRHLNFCNAHTSSGGDWHYDITGGWYFDNATFGNYPNGFEYCTGCNHSTWAYDECGKAREEWISGKQKKLVEKIEEELGPFKRLANVEWTKLLTHPLYGSDRMS